MKTAFTHSIIPAIALAIAVSSPASAQLLGGGGGLGGGLTGGLGGSITRTTGTVTGSTTGSIKGEKQVDRKSGRVRGSGQAQGSSNGSVTGGTEILDRSINTTNSGNASASKSGTVDAQLIGTDAVRSAAQDGVGRGRGAVDTVRGSVGSAVGMTHSAAGNASGAASGAGSIAGNGSGMAQGMANSGVGQLVASGSAAANGAGAFAIEPGMAINDAKGRTIGYVQSVEQTKNGIVQAVTVETGNRTATLPAASFSGSGDALVTGMTKGELNSVAKQQAAQSEKTEQPAPAGSKPASPENAAKPSGVKSREGNQDKER